MGAVPDGIFLNIALPKSNVQDWLKAFTSGLKSDMKKFNLKLYGGDMSSSNKIFLSLTVLVRQIIIVIKKTILNQILIFLLQVALEMQD